MPSGHSCEHKAQVINERTGISLNHDEISFICEQMGFTDTSQFYAWMATLTDEELRDAIKRMMERRRKKYQETEAYVYAVA